MSLGYLVSGFWSPKECQVWFHLDEWVLSQIRYWLIIPRVLFHHCPSITCRQDTVVDQRVCGWVGVYISPLVVYRVPSCTKDACTQGWRSVDTPAWLLHVQWLVFSADHLWSPSEASSTGLGLHLFKMLAKVLSQEPPNNPGYFQEYWLFSTN